MALSKGYIRRNPVDISADSVADGNYDFACNPRVGPNNILEYFYFVDAQGDQVDAGAGQVVITISSGADIFQTVPNGTFAATDARNPDRTKPNGYGTADILRVNLSGVTGAVGFRALLVQFGG